MEAKHAFLGQTCLKAKTPGYKITCAFFSPLHVRSLCRAGRVKLSEFLRSVPIFADLLPPVVRSLFVLRVLLTSAQSVSDRAPIMVDILVLMFFAVMGLVFLSYIIYML